MVSLARLAPTSVIWASLQLPFGSNVGAQTIDLGLVAPLTGPFSAAGRQVQVGAQIAVEEINARGGVGGRKLTLTTMDDQCQPAVAADAASRLVRQKVVAVIGHVCNLASLAAAPIYAGARVLMVTPATTGNDLTDTATQRGWQNIFRVVGRSDAQAYVAATYMARRFGNQPLALVHDSTPYGTELAREVARAMETTGIKPAFEAVVPAGARDFFEVAGRLKSVKPAAVYYAGLAPGAGTLVRQAKELGVDSVFISGDAIRFDDFYRMSGTAGNGVLSTFLPDARQLPSARSAVEQIRKRDFEPEGFTVYAYSAVELIAQTVDRTKSTRLEAMSREIRSGRFETAIGTLRFDNKGDPIVPSYAFYQWQDGKYLSYDARPYWDFTREAGLGSGNGGSSPIVTTSAFAPPPDHGAVISQGVYWNTFFTRGAEADARPNVGSQSTYTLVLDLSAYNYQALATTNALGTEVDPRVRKHLAAALDEPVELKIRPIPVTSELSIEGDRVQTLKIERRKLIRPKDGPDLTEEQTRIANFRSGAIKVARFSNEVAAGSVTFQVRAKKSGCAVIAFTIWDLDNNPLDHLLQIVAVDDGASRANCKASGYVAEALKGGFATLLDPAYVLGPGAASAMIKAAFHIFEFEIDGEKKSLTIFVDKTRYAAPQPTRPETERGVYIWWLQSSFSDYLGKDGGLPFQISEAWQAAFDGHDNAYAKAANELAVTIFGSQPGGEQAATGAKAALERIAVTETAPVVLARFVGTRNQKLYVPLSLIAATGNTQGLSKPITLIQPMEEERYSASGQCVRTWAFGVSGNTADVEENLRSALGSLRSSRTEGERWIGTTDELREYLAETQLPSSTASSPTSGGEGFVLLAHHDGQGVYFNDRTDRLKVENFRRTFGAGSIAFLAACSTSNPLDDMAILRKLNANGVDAMIVSPFRIPVDFGAKLALDFTNMVRSSREQNKTPTLMELFIEASKSTSKYFKDQGDKRMQDMALEFVIVGDPNLKLCDH